MDILPQLSTAFRSMAEDLLGRVHAEVVTATELPEAYFDQLKQRLEQVTGKRVVIERRIDKSIIAGVVARVGDQVFDGSAQHHLSQLKEELLKSQSY